MQRNIFRQMMQKMRKRVNPHSLMFSQLYISTWASLTGWKLQVIMSSIRVFLVSVHSFEDSEDLVSRKTLQKWLNVDTTIRFSKFCHPRNFRKFFGPKPKVIVIIRTFLDAPVLNLGDLESCVSDLALENDWVSTKQLDSRNSFVEKPSKKLRTSTRKI